MNILLIYSIFIFTYLILTLTFVSSQNPESGICVWYGGEDEIPEGWPTASGEGFSRWAMASAHKTLPFSKWVRVTNESNNKTVDVKINDRGPYGKERILDLTYAAFGKIEDHGKGITPCNYVFIP